MTSQRNYLFQASGLFSSSQYSK